MIKELFYEKEEPEAYKKEWRFVPEWMLSGLNTPVCLQWLIDKPKFTIGEAENNDGVLRCNPTVSKQHIIIQCTEQGCFVEDPGTAGGTFVNGRRIAKGKPVQVKNGDGIQLGTAFFVIEKIRRGESK